tara:strand:+ start:3501 stop:3710 length:210 start_codon:yes stop_codon:yes gene_type:complete
MSETVHVGNAKIGGDKLAEVISDQLVEERKLHIGWVDLFSWFGDLTFDRDTSYGEILLLAEQQFSNKPG